MNFVFFGQSDQKVGTDGGGFVFLGKLAYDKNPQDVVIGRLPVGTVELSMKLLDAGDIKNPPEDIAIFLFADDSKSFFFRSAICARVV